MSKTQNLKLLVEKIPKYEMSKKCQSLALRFGRKYFKGKTIEQVKKRLSKKRGGIAGVVYKRLGQVKEDCLSVITPYLAQHINNFKDDCLFAKAVIEYSAIYGNLEEEIFDVFKEVYKNKEKIDLMHNRKALETFGRDPALYNFIIDNILKESKGFKKDYKK